MQCDGTRSAGNAPERGRMCWGDNFKRPRAAAPFATQATSVFDHWHGSVIFRDATPPSSPDFLRHHPSSTKPGEVFYLSTIAVDHMNVYSPFAWRCHNKGKHLPSLSFQIQL